MTEAKMKLENRYRAHGAIIAYVLLAAAVVVAIWMIQKEVDARSGKDRIITQQVDAETEARIEENERLLEVQHGQITEMQRINRVQTQILRALLAAERKDPTLFNGVDLPRLSSLLDRTTGRGGGAETQVPTGPVSRGGGAPPTSPGNNNNGNPSPPHRPPNPSTHPDPVHPKPVDPKPEPPCVRACTPDPEPPSPIDPIIDAVEELPVVGPIVEPIISDTVKPAVDPVVSEGGLAAPPGSFDGSLAGDLVDRPATNERAIMSIANPTSTAHEFVEGRDMIERCAACGTTKTKGGMVIPATAPCPTRSHEVGAVASTGRTSTAPQYVTPLEAFLIDMGLAG